MALPDKENLDDIYANDVYYRYFRFTEDGGRVVHDGVTSNSTEITSAQANFVAADVGKEIFGTGITIGTTISSIGGDGTTATLSDTVSGSASGATFIIRSIDISAYTFTAQIRRTPLSTNTVADITIDTTNAAGGELLFSLDAETTGSLPINGYWDLQTVLDGDPVTWLRGRTKVTPDTTRAA